MNYWHGDIACRRRRGRPQPPLAAITPLSKRKQWLFDVPIPRCAQLPAPCPVCATSARHRLLVERGDAELIGLVVLPAGDDVRQLIAPQHHTDAAPAAARHLRCHVRGVHARDETADEKHRQRLGGVVDEEDDVAAQALQQPGDARPVEVLLRLREEVGRLRLQRRGEGRGELGRPRPAVGADLDAVRLGLPDHREDVGRLVELCRREEPRVVEQNLRRLPSLAVELGDLLLDRVDLPRRAAVEQQDLRALARLDAADGAVGLLGPAEGEALRLVLVEADAALALHVPAEAEGRAIVHRHAAAAPHLDAVHPDVNVREADRAAAALPR
eukprot:CAMPEP_0195617574 /NCGR_PEP_ID=MMETSP0815-20121206/13626_1 /TAXON_ID=97485 /ORGANISM="Prymnesium parvum, Strain Texoma1" /LENGTH=327 /DNA_ID=CAMNT_0040758061 /DNA_START=378 /DNA_END=1358 /DNA_ORIENTATION=-